MPIISIANQKGGVGKTTTAVSLGAYLSHSRRVLLVDMDPQSNASTALGIEESAVRTSIYEVLIEGAPLADAVMPTRHPGLYLVPSARRLAGAEVEMVSMPDREALLGRALGQVSAGYDLVILDCPPSLGLLTVNGLAASDGVVIPVQCEYLALEGLGQLINTIELVRQGLNPRLEILGVLLTMHDSRTNLSTQVVEEVRSHFDRLTFQSVIPRNVRLSEAPSYGRTIVEYDPVSRGALAYAAFANEVAARVWK